MAATILTRCRYVRLFLVITTDPRVISTLRASGTHTLNGRSSQVVVSDATRRDCLLMESGQGSGTERHPDGTRGSRVVSEGIDWLTAEDAGSRMMQSPYAACSQSHRGRLLARVKMAEQRTSVLPLSTSSRQPAALRTISPVPTRASSSPSSDNTRERRSVGAFCGGTVLPSWSGIMS